MDSEKKIDELTEGGAPGARAGKGASSSSRGRGGRGGRNAGRGEGREVAVSKALSKLLRHAAEDEGLILDGEGFGRVDQVVSFWW